MSELRIGLVAEGATDELIIGAALRAFLDRPFVLTRLQPEATRPDLGQGWGGVLKWCLAFRETGLATLEADPRLEGFDLLILHLDTDVAHRRYLDYGQALGATAARLQLAAMPCVRPCPPASAAVQEVRGLLQSWLNIAIGPRTILCIPSQCSEAWLAAALLADHPDLMAGLECEPNLEGVFANLPKAQRVRKSPVAYRTRVPAITARWSETVKTNCPQAAEFEAHVLAATTPAT